MDQYNLKQLMELLLDIIECINKENKLQLIQLPVFSLGQEVLFTEPNLIKIQNYKISLKFLNNQLFKQLNKDS